MTPPGRKSAALLEVNALKEAMSPKKPPPTPDILAPAEKALFHQLRAANPHLTDTDTSLLVCYCQAVTQTHRLGRGKDVMNWERAVRCLMALSTKLKLTPQADRRVDRTGGGGGGGCGVTWQQLEQRGQKPWEDELTELNDSVMADEEDNDAE
jgi:hypothetical protein